MNTLQIYLGMDKSKLQSIFVDPKDDEEKMNQQQFATEDKVKRKWVLISSDYKSAFKTK
jgi:hypothetical protein